MDIKFIVENNTLHVHMIGELDEYSANYTRQNLDDIIDSNFFNTIVFNFKDLNFMDSTGIGVMLGRYKILKRKNVGVYISNANKTIDKIFNMSGIYEIMPKIS